MERSSPVRRADQSGHLPGHPQAQYDQRPEWRHHLQLPDLFVNSAAYNDGASQSTGIKGNARRELSGC
jgi:hypothetical protein